jgi:hypothetical protein
LNAVNVLSHNKDAVLLPRLTSRLEVDVAASGNKAQVILNDDNLDAFEFSG